MANGVVHQFFTLNSYDEEEFDENAARYLPLNLRQHLLVSA
jgi:hypothetical protein